MNCNRESDRRHALIRDVLAAKTLMNPFYKGGMMDQNYNDKSQTGGDMKKVERIPESVGFEVSTDGYNTDMQRLHNTINILRDSMNELTDAFNELVDKVRLGVKLGRE